MGFVCISICAFSAHDSEPHSNAVVVSQFDGQALYTVQICSSEHVIVIGS
jgi:hypothetical protein